ncbi:hypothetical protein BD769DRAFT_1679166 [Suillus cothurnatus]|nr:hypothetical protein BD769DRAFT_1679166 [Suillus cothurnatus]
MAPSSRKMFRQNYFGKPYDLRSSSSKSSPNATSSITSATSNNDTFRLELQATCKIAIKVNVLAIDTARLREELITAKHEREQVFMQRDNITSAHQRLKQGVKVALQCPTCEGVIEQPFTLECRHTFCYDCLINFFHQCIRVRLSFRPEAILPENFRNHVLPFTLAEVEILCDGEAPILPGRYYHCPTCRAYIHDPPTEIPLLCDMAASITKGLGPDIKRATRGVPMDPAARWAVFFK